jgi:ribosome-binding protein aMBF1 (putative translation factor)
MVDMINGWNRENIRSLRLRLGWSRADLARRLSCSSSDVGTWEEGRQTPDTQVANELILIAKHADACSEEIRTSPRAESLCESKALGQIDFSQIKEEIE